MKLNTIDLAKFGMFGAIIYASKVAMASLPNIHLVAVFIAALTLVYRKKAIFPVIVYILFEGIFGGFTIYWLPYIYIWLMLWGVFMLMPQNISEKAKPWVYMITIGLHGLLYGTLCTPIIALALRMDFKASIAWIASGLSYDAIHGISNFCLGILIVPITRLLKRLERA